jgi:hypothetical protein
MATPLYDDAKSVLKDENIFRETIENKNYNSDGTLHPVDTIEYYGFNYIFMIMKCVYSQEIYNEIQKSGTRNKIMTKMNEIITEYNNVYLGNNTNVGKWVNKDLQDVCDPSNPNFSCNPKQLLNLRELSPLSGNLYVKNKEREKCSRKCGPDCSDGCFFTPSIPQISPDSKIAKYFSNNFESCSCIPCFNFVEEDGNMKCFQSEVVPNILEILLNNFRNIYASTNDSNPRTAYYIFTENFDDEYDIEEDIRLAVKILEDFINNSRDPLNSENLAECQRFNSTKDSADPNCNNSEKIFCKNVNIDIPQADIYNCINTEHTIMDILNDNINSILNPTEMEYCYCQEINPINGNIIDTTEKTWMSRKTCQNLNVSGENFHICSDNSYSNELIKELKSIKNKCDSGDIDEDICSESYELDSENYESYLFNFDYRAPITNTDNCESDNKTCLSYSDAPGNVGETGAQGTPGGSGSSGGTPQSGTPPEEEEEEDSFIKLRDDIKADSIFKYATQNYCHCIQKDTNCNTWETCYGEEPTPPATPTTATAVGSSEGGAGISEKLKCSDVHSEIFGDAGEATRSPNKFDNYINMNAKEKNLAKNNIIDRNICESNLKCLGYTCENGGADNSNGSSAPHDSNMSSLRNLLYPLTPSYTGLSLKYRSLYGAGAAILNTNDQSVNIDTSGLMEAAGYGEGQTVSKVINDSICQYGETINQYASIDARASEVDENDMTSRSRRVWQALDPTQYGGCLQEEVKTILSSIPGVDAPGTHICKSLAQADTGFFGNMTSYVNDYVDQVENSAVAGSLSTVGNRLTGFCAKGDESTKPIKIDYGYIRNNFIYFAAIILFIIAIPTIGPLAFLIASIITVSWQIYAKIKKSVQNVDGYSENEADALGFFWFMLLAIILICVFYVTKNKGLRKHIYHKSKKMVTDMKSDMSDFNMFD